METNLEKLRQGTFTIKPVNIWEEPGKQARVGAAGAEEFQGHPLATPGRSAGGKTHWGL